MTSKNAGRIKAAVKSLNKQPKDSGKKYVIVRAKNTQSYVIMELVPVLKLKSTCNLVEEKV